MPSKSRSPPTGSRSPASRRIDRHLRELGDWRGEVLSRVRRLIHEADPEVAEEWKWQKATSPGVPVWSRQGILCTGETYKATVKLTFAHGAALPDPSGLFNAGLAGKTRRAIDIREGQTLPAGPFKKLVRAAAAFNEARRAG